MNTPAEIPFSQLLDALLDGEHPFHARYLYRLSDLEGEELADLSAIWSRVPGWRRKALMEDIEDISERDTLLSFEALARLAISDEDPIVRGLAVRILEEYEPKDLIPRFIQMAETDRDEHVRANATHGLGKYVYLGELDDIPKTAHRNVEECLLRILHGNDVPHVRQRALESLGYSSRKEINLLIQKAFDTGERDWMASALCAMGYSANNRWRPQVTAMLSSQQPRLRSEAARAAGELEFSSAVPILIDLLDDPDDDTRRASIWSLSQIGGKGVREVLERLYRSTDNEDDLRTLDEALENLAFTDGTGYMPLLYYSDEEQIDDNLDELEGNRMDDLDLSEDEDELD